MESNISLVSNWRGTFNFLIVFLSYVSTRFLLGHPLFGLLLRTEVVGRDEKFSASLTLRQIVIICMFLIIISFFIIWHCKYVNKNSVSF